MPYSSISEARIKELDGTPLTLSQINGIAAMADAIGDNGWPIAINKFKKTHHKEGGKWVKSGGEEKEYSDVIVSKDNGKWKIIAISTAAFKDQDDETFTTTAIDYDLKAAEHFQSYPEFRMFHKKGLAFGRVSKMQRVGPFAVDSGYAYDDPFSQQVAEKILSQNDGTWRVSRGFYVHEISGGCPECGTKLLLRKEHMSFGFRCPVCKSIHLKKGVLKDRRFLKARTFDITVTDIPCVPYTGVGAYKENIMMEDFVMDKKELRKKLIDAGLDEKDVDERLATVTEKQLKDFTDLPDAEVFKQLDIEDEDEETEEKDKDNEQTFVLDEEVLKSFDVIVRKSVREEVASQLKDLEIQVADLDGFDIDLKELPQIAELLKEVKDLNAKFDKLMESDKERVTKMLTDLPRAGKLRIRRFKEAPKDDEEDQEDDGDMGDEEEIPEEMKKQKVTVKQIQEGVPVDGSGKAYGTMTDMIFGGGGK